MKKVLFVDDEVWAIAGLQTILDWKAFGFEIIDCCTSAEDAYDSILINKPDVVFTDIRMPEFTGIELIAKIREQGINVPVVITSGYSDFDVACEAIKYNAYHYLLKPLERAKVEEVVASLSKLLNSMEKDSHQKSNQLQLEEYSVSQNPIVAEIQEYLSKNFNEDISLKNLAKIFYLSETYLCDLFKKNTGLTISSFVRGIRLTKAQIMMANTGKSLSEIAEAIGYKDYSYFGKLFKSKFGASPEEFRKKNTA